METRSGTPRQAPADLDDARAEARQAGLHYTSDRRPGITRRRAGKNFSYTGPDGTRITDEKTLARIKSIVVPPAWTEVWISADPVGHIQATGRDARGRKQYRYHPRWRAARDDNKYNRMLEFAAALPRVRRRVRRDLGRTGLPREKVLATVIRLLEGTLIRVGNEEYARTNNSFGLTTLRERHVRVRGARVRFRFRGKSGREHDLEVADPRVARVIRRLQDLPGQEVFQYLDDDGDLRSITSTDVNDYIREVSGRDFTAKDFRTWAGTVTCATALRAMEAIDGEAGARRNIVAAVERVAERLGNTVAVSRRCYIHPAVLDAYADGTLLDTMRQRADDAIRNDLRGLPGDEAAVLVLLRQRLAADARGAA